MNISTQLLDYNALEICTSNLTNKCDNYLWNFNYWCCCYGNKVIHNSCNMCICDLPGMYALMSMLQLLHVTPSHLRSKRYTGIHKPCIPVLFLIPRVHLKVDQRVQRNNFPGIHLNVHQCTSGCIPGKLFL